MRNLQILAVTVGHRREKGSTACHSLCCCCQQSNMSLLRCAPTSDCPDDVIAEAACKPEDSSEKEGPVEMV